MTLSVPKMLPKLDDIIDPDHLEKMIAEKYVSVQEHPAFWVPYRIYNYTHNAMYDKVWNETTKQCRGLIVDDEGTIISRPMKKFFNFGQDGCPKIADTEPVIVSDKLDGSLGICYPYPEGGWGIATRGSFASEQADHATKLWAERYGHIHPRHDITFMFEIVYPENRIVLDYGKQDDLILHTAVDIATGEILPLTLAAALISWTGPVAMQFDAPTWIDALMIPPRPNAEGIVVFVPRTNEHVKIKQDDYVELHRIMTNTSARTLWQFMAVNACKSYIEKPKHWESHLGIYHVEAQHILDVGSGWLQFLKDKVPDEFYVWMQTTMAGIDSHVGALQTLLYMKLARYLQQNPTRAEFAKAIAHEKYKGLLFLMFDGKDITLNLWKDAYPEASTPWMTAPAEDVA